MALFKCKHCGEALDLSIAVNGVCKCNVCNMYQTVSTKVDSSPNAETLYGNASHFRKNHEFDLAITVYQQILALDDSDAEAYFSVALCRYGIEYVKDPKTENLLPTVNRTQLKAFSEDDDFILALENATGEQRAEYLKQAELIDEILRGYWQISNNEDPFDVFICYKETALDGESRTEDSAIAAELYRALTNDGIKVFFARETLKDKLGSEYEPYIFAALNSARFMLVIGTRKEHLNAVWVKNEWARYMSLIDQGKKKTLIPVYKGISPYDLPREFKNIQGQDYGTFSAKDDILIHIERVLRQEKPETVVVKETTKVVEQPVYQGAVSGTQGLIKRGYELLEQGKFEQALDCCERIIDKDFECGEGYFIKFLAENKFKTVDEFEKRGGDYKVNATYSKARMYADDSLNEKLDDAEKGIVYCSAKAKLEGGSYEAALSTFRALGKFRDSEARVKECQNAIKKAIFESACELQKAKRYEDAINKLRQVYDYADASARIKQCETAIKDDIYAQAIVQMNGKSYEAAISLFEKIISYKDAQQKISECETGIKQLVYDNANTLYEAKQFDKAYKLFLTILGFKDVQARLEECEESRQSEVYEDASFLMRKGDFSGAKARFAEIQGYKDARSKVDECEELRKKAIYDSAVSLMQKKEYKKAIEKFTQVQSYRDSASKITECGELINEGIYENALSLMKSKQYKKAITEFKKVNTYKDSGARISECERLILQAEQQAKYDNAYALYEQKNYAGAILAFSSVKGFGDAEDMIKKCRRKIAAAKRRKAFAVIAIILLIIASMPLYIHIPGDWIVQDEATCTVTGEHYTQCLICKKEMSREKFRLAHSFENGSCTECNEKQPYNVIDNDTILLGTYPQSEVLDDSLKTVLNELAGALPSDVNPHGWTSYGYYMGGNVKDYMWYIDIENNGEKYRGVYFTSYRPDTCNSSSGGYQKNNGYTVSNIYWFKYEPISWTILSKENNTALILCDLIIDSQQFDYKNEGSSNNYPQSTIREWLNETFYETAFDGLQNEIILTITVDNSETSAGYTSDTYAREDTRDKVFLLSVKEAKNSEYGFDTGAQNAARQKKTTAYAKSQGAYTYESSPYEGNGNWWTRSLNFSSSVIAHAVSYDSYINYNHYYKRDHTVYSTVFGVVPAIKIHLHQSFEWEIIEEPSCENEGVGFRKCLVCGEEFGEEAIPKSHISSDWITDSEATCTTEGSRYKKCTKCQDELVREVIAVIPHISEEWLIEGNCLTNGSRYKKCDTCQTEFGRESLPDAHTSGDWIIDAEPTCTTNGSKHKECVNCLQESEREEIVTSGHPAQTDWIIDTQPTCVTGGSQHKECTVCGTQTATEPISPKGHTLTDWITDNAATCTAAGSQYKKCTDCKEEIQRQSITKLPHTESGWITDKAATCTAAGSQYKKCTVCQGELQRQSITKLPHTESGWITDKAATCTAAGSQYTKCTVCKGELQRQSITQLPHTESGWITDKETSCIAAGSQYTKCTVCNTELGREAIARLYHEYVNGYCKGCNSKQPYTVVDSDTILFGSYPQTEVTDNALTTELNAKVEIPTSSNAKGWTSYRYYDVFGQASDYMWYIDIEHGGEKYRGVYFNGYRRASCGGGNLCPQEKNGYTLKTTYWFKYEPISWTVLEEENGEALILCDLIIDSQQYDYEYYYGKKYSNNYEEATIRSWLLYSFYLQAFDELQQQIVLTTQIDGRANVNDKAFLISAAEYSSYTAAGYDGVKKATDYAKAQGAYNYGLDTTSENGVWLLRDTNYYEYDDTYVYDDYTNAVNTDGTVVSGNTIAVEHIMYGIVPALTIQLK